MNSGAVRAMPFRESSISTSWGIPKRGTGDNLEQCMVNFLKIWFKLVLNINNESGCDRREQTSLFTTWGSHKDQGAYGEILMKTKVLFKSSSYFLTKPRS